MDQLDDEFDNNDGKDVGIDGVIDNKNGNNFEVTRILVHFRGYQTRKSIRERNNIYVWYNLLQDVIFHGNYSRWKYYTNQYIILDNFFSA